MSINCEPVGLTKTKEEKEREAIEQHRILQEFLAIKKYGAGAVSPSNTATPEDPSLAGMEASYHAAAKLKQK